MERVIATSGSIRVLDGGLTRGVACFRKERSKEGIAAASRCKVDQGETCEKQR